MKSQKEMGLMIILKATKNRVASCLPLSISLKNLFLKKPLGGQIKSLSKLFRFKVPPRIYFG